MFATVPTDRPDDGSELAPGLFLRRINGQEAPILTNVAERARRERKRGSALINIATALLLVLAIALYVVSISAQWAYVMDVKHDNVVSWIEAASLDGGMAVFTLLALGLSRAGQAARIERLFIVICAIGSAAMNEQAARTTSLRDVLAYTVPPLFLAAVVDRTVSVIRRHYLGDDDASAWSQLGRFCLYAVRLIAAPLSTVTGLRRALLNATPLPTGENSPPDPVVDASHLMLRQLGPVEPVRAISAAPARAVTAKQRTRSLQRKAQAKKSGKPGGKQAELIRLALDNHGLAELPIGDVSKLATSLAADVDLHPATARRVLVAHARALQNGGGE